MVSRRSIDDLFRPFEGTRDALPLSVFRIAFFGGLALHFFPSLLWLDEGYGPTALRANYWNHDLYLLFARLPHGVVRLGSVVTMVACVAGIVGYKPRVAALLSGLGFYAFASFNALHLQTLALIQAWAILPLWAICGGGSAALSVDAWLRRRSDARAGRDSPPSVEPRLLSGLVLFQVLLGVFFAGIEKLLADWPRSNEMGVLMSYPRGFMLRDWVVGLAWMHSPYTTHALSWLTLVVELGTPLGLLFRKTRLVSLVAYEAFFLGIIGMMAVPPLFYCVFAFGALLALDDDQVRRAWAAISKVCAP